MSHVLDDGPGQLPQWLWCFGGALPQPGHRHFQVFQDQRREIKAQTLDKLLLNAQNAQDAGRVREEVLAIRAENTRIQRKRYERQEKARVESERRAAEAYDSAVLAAERRAAMELPAREEAMAQAEEIVLVPHAHVAAAAVMTNDEKEEIDRIIAGVMAIWNRQGWSVWVDAEARDARARARAHERKPGVQVQARQERQEKREREQKLKAAKRAKISDATQRLCAARVALEDLQRKADMKHAPTQWGSGKRLRVVNVAESITADQQGAKCAATTELPEAEEKVRELEGELLYLNR